MRAPLILLLTTSLAPAAPTPVAARAPAPGTAAEAVVPSSDAICCAAARVSHDMGRIAPPECSITASTLI